MTLDRVTNRSNLFSFGRTHFQKGCGLWFAVVWRKPGELCGDIPFSKALETALTELSLTGIGGDRSVGFGRFTWKTLGSSSWPDPIPGGYGVLLSRCYPRPEELDLLRRTRAWKLMEVGGWAETAQGHVRRNRIFLITEGAVVSNGLVGGLVDLRPPEFTAHPIWRYGYALLYPREVKDAH